MYYIVSKINYTVSQGTFEGVPVLFEHLYYFWAWNNKISDIQPLDWSNIRVSMSVVKLTIFSTLSALFNTYKMWQCVVFWWELMCFHQVFIRLQLSIAHSFSVHYHVVLSQVLLYTRSLKRPDILSMTIRFCHAACCHFTTFIKSSRT